MIWGGLDLDESVINNDLMGLATGLRESTPSVHGGSESRGTVLILNVLQCT